MQFNFKNDEGEVVLKNIKLLKDVKTIEKGTPRLGSTCTFEILTKPDSSTEKNENGTCIPLANSIYPCSDLSETKLMVTTIGITCSSEFDRLIDVCLTRLHEGESGDFAVNCTRSKSSFNVSLKLVSIEDSPELFDLSIEKVVDIAETLKAQGVDLFKKGFYVDSFHKFSQAFKFLSTISPSLSDAHQTLLVNLQSNMASCHIKYGNWEEAIDLCNSVLDCDKSNVKALYRRGLSFTEIQEYEKASEDLQNAKRLDPGNQAVKSKLVILNEKRKALDAKYAIAMKKFFS